MSVQHLLKLRMASHSYPAAPPTTRPLSALSSLLTPAAPSPASLSCSRPYYYSAAGRCCTTVGRRLQASWRCHRRRCLRRGPSRSPRRSGRPSSHRSNSASSASRAPSKKNTRLPFSWPCYLFYSWNYATQGRSQQSGKAGRPPEVAAGGYLPPVASAKRDTAMSQTKGPAAQHQSLEPVLLRFYFFPLPTAQAPEASSRNPVPSLRLPRGILEQVNMTSSSVRVFINVLGAEPPCTNHLQSSTQGVVGQHSMKDFLEP